jgi:hypothetical protein
VAVLRDGEIGFVAKDKNAIIQVVAITASE